MKFILITLLLAYYMRTGDLRDHLVQRQVNLSELMRP